MGGREREKSNASERKYCECCLRFLKDVDGVHIIIIIVCLYGFENIGNTCLSGKGVENTMLAREILDFEIR